jgi:general secretion pathway protein E
MTTLQPFADAGGLTIVTGRPGVGKSSAALDAAADAARAGRVAWSVEEHPVGEFAGVLRTTAADGTFAVVSAAILNTDADVVVIDEVFDSERAAFAARLALTGRTVLAVMPAGDALEALDWFTELATRDEATELGVYTALTAVVRLGDEPDVFTNTREATRALIDGRPSAEIRAAGGRPRTRAA